MDCLDDLVVAEAAKVIDGDIFLFESQTDIDSVE